MKSQDVKKKVINQFGKNAEKYVTSETHAKSQDLPLLVEWLQPQNDWKVLDIATGGGHVAKALSPHVSQVFASDLTKGMLEKAEKHLQENCDNISYVLADAESLPFLDNTYDAVTCRLAPHHFPNPDVFIQEVARVLKPGGFFLMIDNVAPEDQHLADFMNTFEKLRDESHARCLSVGEWREFFVDTNLKEVQSGSQKKTYTFPAWVERTASNQAQIDRVYDYIMDGSEESQTYFHVTFDNKTVQSLQIDQWMVLCEKRTG